MTSKQKKNNATREARLAEIAHKDGKPLFVAKLPVDIVGNCREAMICVGRCMEPTILHGAAVGFDIDDTELVEGEIYIFEIGRSNPKYQIKRLKQIIAGACLVLETDNPSYLNPIVAEGDYRVIGRVKWVYNEGFSEGRWMPSAA